MTIDIQEAKRKFGKLNYEIESVLRNIGSYCDNVDYNHDDLDESFLKSQFSSVIDDLENVNRKLNYLSKKVVDQGFLKHNEAKRYQLPNGYYLTSGDECEILVTDDDEQYWIYTTIEHNDEDYYATALGKNVSIKGMMARIRRYS